jgi:PAS domain S-box-containing protein
MATFRKPDSFAPARRSRPKLSGPPGDVSGSERPRANGALAEVRAALARERAAREAAQCEAREKDALYRQLVENQPDLICSYLPDTTLTFVNAAYARFFGTTPEDLLGRPFLDLLGAAERDAVREHLARLTPAAPSVRYERQTLSADGMPRWHLWHDFACFERDGRPTRFQSIGLDITERVYAEQAAGEREVLYRRLLEGLPDIFYTYSVAGGGLYWSPSVERILGYSPERVHAQPYLWHDAIHPEDLPRVDAAIRGFEKGHPIQVEYRIRAADGRWVWLYDRSIGRRSQGDSTIIEGIATDITDRKRAEAEVRRLNERLEEKVRQRTRDLEASNRELEAFAYSVSHDLRAPLRAIDGFSLALMEEAEGLDEACRGYLTRVRSNAQRMAQMIDELLTISRVARGHLECDRVDLTGLVRSVFDELRQSDPGRAVEFEVGEGMACYGDRRLLRVLVQNLLENAWKYTAPRDPAHIQVGAAGPGCYFVRDDGVGFSMEHADRLFRVFQRLHTDREFEGTGIGLATVRRIVQRHGGRVWAEAEEGAGATFHFTLPDPEDIG